ncbi:DUF1983 domain-containing protein [Klebsiella indica]|uniref:DUF1983 domain-containing protein n=2 Tax=Klebsiella TaxID=570 RepID=A0A5R9LLW3_9ENTR|nr:DUF1983 domain-containing protein [Klebsiella indica]TLV21671.1 DUF1983 domain-containing protein [Klebsiella indica]
MKQEDDGDVVGNIVLGSDGSTSDMILYADRFSLFNRNSKTSVPVMIAEGNELYIDKARIKDGSVDNAKIGNVIQSNDFASGSKGWQVNKNGKAEFNDVTVRGKIEATSGELDNVVINESCTISGTLSADKIVGDISDTLPDQTIFFSENIGNDGTKTVRFCRIKQQSFQQKVTIVGSILMNDSAGRQNAIVYENSPSDRLNLGSCAVGMVACLGMTAGGSGSGTYFLLRAGGTQIWRQSNAGRYNTGSFSVSIPTGDGYTDVECVLHNASNATGTIFMLSRYHVFVSRSGSVITK